THLNTVARRRQRSVSTRATGALRRSSQFTRRATISTVTARFRQISSMKPRSGKSPSTTVNLTVPDRRSRRYLTEREVERLMDCARKHSRHGHRDATMVLVAYRHGLRASETCDLQWHQIELAEGRMHVHRAKRGIPSVHPIRG